MANFKRMEIINHKVSLPFCKDFVRNAYVKQMSLQAKFLLRTMITDSVVSLTRQCRKRKNIKCWNCKGPHLKRLCRAVCIEQTLVCIKIR